MAFDFECRPGFARRTFSLNGEWNFWSSDSETDARPDRLTQIPVPSLVDCSASGDDWHRHQYHHHECTFSLDSLPADRHAILVIEQAMFGTAVQLNDGAVGRSNRCYTSQRYLLDPQRLRSGSNTLRITVGGRSTLPPESAAGRDQERSEFIPGIWGDVRLILCGSPAIRSVQIVPNLAQRTAELHVTLENISTVSRTCDLETIITESPAGNVVARKDLHHVEVSSGGTQRISLTHTIAQTRPWSPSDPFLYHVTVRVSVAGQFEDEWTGRFGMRDFEIRGKQFFLNGEPIFLKGGNIAFHRFLDDRERALLPWDMTWVRKVLVDIPKAHHFNFFRFHLGHAYNRWYDLADEHGILLQDEWPFWNATGSNAEIEQEFRAWIEENANHPSIVIWDPLNESTDDSIVHDIVPAMREQDPSRVWESVDFHEQHPYVYSLGMTYNFRQLGYTAALPALENSPKPVVVNEFLWWWLDSNWKPTVLMEGVVERWLGRSPSVEQIIERQTYLAEELIGMFRRMRCAAIQPFVYLSNNDGPTAHWFQGPIAELRPKPLLAALKNAFAPFGVSIDLADRHFRAGEKVAFDVHVFNDRRLDAVGTLQVELVDGAGKHHIVAAQEVRVKGYDRVIVAVPMTCRDEEGTYILFARLRESGSESEAISRKTIHVLSSSPRLSAARRLLVVLDPLDEVMPFLHTHNVSYDNFSAHELAPNNVLFVNTFGCERREYRERLDAITSFVKEGGLLIIQEPEFRTVEPKNLRITEELALKIERRNDVDKGGYDSYVFPEDASHAIWKTLDPGHLRWFNGAPGGEIVSEYNVVPNQPFDLLASCGLGLRIPAVMSFRYGKGKVIVSRIQIRGRLDEQRRSMDRFARRYDPVASQYLMNLISL